MALSLLSFMMCELSECPLLIISI